MSEVVDFLNPVAAGLSAEASMSLSALADKVFSTWNGSLVVERGNREVREKETRDSLNHTLKACKQWDALRSRRVNQANGMDELEPPPLGAEKPPTVNYGIFCARGHEETLDLDTITHRRT
jgi:hypothetical protein